MKLPPPVRLDGNRREDARSADLLVELAGGDQDRVANLLGLEPLAREDGEQLVLGIDLGDILAIVG